METSKSNIYEIDGEGTYKVEGVYPETIKLLRKENVKTMTDIISFIHKQNNGKVGNFSVTKIK